MNKQELISGLIYGLIEGTKLGIHSLIFGYALYYFWNHLFLNHLVYTEILYFEAFMIVLLLSAITKEYK